jgi:hypothetical protein
VVVEPLPVEVDRALRITAALVTSSLILGELLAGRPVRGRDRAAVVVRVVYGEARGQLLCRSPFEIPFASPPLRRSATATGPSAASGGDLTPILARNARGMERGRC